MPTYSFRCAKCGDVQDTVMSIGAYVATPPTFFHCCEPMERFFEVNGGAAVANALAGDRHYDGLQATDGTDISTRAKHRAYMKERGLTTVDDFAGTWKKQAAEREARMTGTDSTRKADIAAAIQQHRQRR
jgi:hypothetical protein